ncbi:hypothetical protein FH610_007195 [Microbispora catharanthi]|uniref:Uncharacterized protein n=1 Tax=Microbispora catharanthi TaxID=1712871 RepID=A0A5N6C1C8_9ACTN|nr:hypothetical protein FH610_007195 [Microbispora catharanthi]
MIHKPAPPTTAMPRMPTSTPEPPPPLLLPGVRGSLRLPPANWSIRWTKSSITATGSPLLLAAARLAIWPAAPREFLPSALDPANRFVPSITATVAEVRPAWASALPSCVMYAPACCDEVIVPSGRATA